MVSPRMERRIERFRRIVDRLSYLASKDVGELSDIELDALERNVHVLIEILVGMGNHVIAGKEWERAKTYRDVARILGKHKVLSGDEARLFEGLIGLRNVLVDLYADVDLDLLVRIVRNELSSWVSLFNKLLEYMVREGIDP